VKFLIKVLNISFIPLLLVWITTFGYFAWLCGSGLLSLYERGRLSFAEGASYGWIWLAVFGLGSTIGAIWCAKFLFLIIKERFFDKHETTVKSE